LRWFESEFCKRGFFGQKIRLKIKKASKFEIGMYLLFRLDSNMFGKQTESTRGVLCDSCMKSILPRNDQRFIDLVYHRLEVYGEIFDRIRDSGGSWADYIQECNDWLFNAILYCENDYNKMTTSEMPNIIIDPICQLMPIKMAMSSIEATLLVMFECILKHVFADNKDFTLLSEKELLRRIKAGQKEGLSISKKDNHAKQ